MLKFLEAVKAAASAPGKDWLGEQLKLAEAIDEFEDRLRLGEAVVAVVDEIPIRVMPEVNGLQVFVADEDEPRVILDVFEGKTKACVFSAEIDEARVVVSFDDRGVIENVELPKP